MSLKPPESLTKETVGVWNGWGNMGEKEIAREAATKGLHIPLAITFLSLKLDKTRPETENWFNNEVLNWVIDLLERNQIFRAAHILNNIGSDPKAEFRKVFYTTSNAKLRESVGNHLKKQHDIEATLEKSWNFLNIFVDNKQYFDNLPISTIQDFENQSEELKSKIATILFLKTQDEIFADSLQAEALWAYLLETRDLVQLSLWIRVNYDPNFDTSNSKLSSQLKKFPITVEMLNVVYKVDADFQNLLLNEFARYGIFEPSESTSFSGIFRRLKCSGNLGTVTEILSRKSSTVTLDNFGKFLIDYSNHRQFFKVSADLAAFFKNIDAGIPNFSFWGALTESGLKENIVKIIPYLADDFPKYLTENPLVFLTILVFDENEDVFEILSQKSGFVLNEHNLADTVQILLEQYPILQKVLIAKDGGEWSSAVSVYELFSDSKFFAFRSKSTEYPTFRSASFGYKKGLDFGFYLKTLRPCLAVESSSEESTKTKEEKAVKLAIEHFENNELVASCMAFLEILQSETFSVRILVKIARILLASGIDKDVIQNMIKEPEMVLENLENILIKGLDGQSFCNAARMVETIKLFELPIKFAKFFGLKYPDKFLKYCAKRNLYLPFLIFIQIHSYPIEQVKCNVQYFRSANILEHLSHSLLNDIQVEDRHVLIRERDSRKYLLSRVGVRNTVEGILKSGSLRSCSSEDSSHSSDSFEIDVSNLKTTLLQTLIRCHNSTDPPKAFLQACQLYRNPLLAVFATTYEPDSVITNWLTWLSVSCELCPRFTNFETIAISANAVTDLLEKCLQKKFIKTLLESFEIFIPHNPLKIFIELLVNFSRLKLNEKFVHCQLESFFQKLRGLRKNSIITEADREMSYFSNRAWLEKTSLRLLSAFLDFNCKSLHAKIQILEVLPTIPHWGAFTENLDISPLLKILRIIYASGSCVKLDISGCFNPGRRRESLISCINGLIDVNLYATALEVAQTVDLPVDLIFLKKYEKRREESNRNLYFWQECNEEFTKNNLTADCVVDFFLEHAQKTEDLDEKFTLLKFAFEWSLKFDLSCRYEIECEMWISYLKGSQPQMDFTAPDASPSLYKDFVGILLNYPTGIFEQALPILERVLNSGNFFLALKLERIFSCKSPDLEILKLCYSLAEGLLLPHQLDSPQRLLLAKNWVKMVSNTSPIDGAESIQNDVLTILKLLAEKLQNGAKIGQHLIMSYRISLNIKVPYDVVVMTTDSWTMLRDALENDCQNKLEVVHDCIAIYKMTKQEIIGFVCEEIIVAVSNYVSCKSEFLILWDLDLNRDFFLVIQLLQNNCTALGQKMYQYLSVLYLQSKESAKSSDLHLVIELLIRTHDCFTADCNMEGIAMVLKRSKEIISFLLILEEWKLIVRLLTGVGRYTEMTYVFQILLENEQFEFLLHKSLKRDNALKVALIEYLRKFWPNNSEIYKIVALNFTLFSEVAMLWETEARKIISNMLKVAKLEMEMDKLNPELEPFILLVNNGSTVRCLNKAMENYTHATEFHLQGEKISRALKSTKQAELLALQLSFLQEIPPNNKQISLFNLSNTQIITLISTKLKFDQAILLVESYNFTPDWGMVLFEQYFNQSNEEFFEKFLIYFSLNEKLVCDIFYKFFTPRDHTEAKLAKLKKILRNFANIDLKYKIASEYGFGDLISDWILSGELVYLKDTVWKKGYKSQ